MTRIVLRSLVPLIVCVACGRSLSMAQEINGLLLDAASKRPVQGGLVRLFESSGTLLDSLSTGPTGAFRFVLREPGIYGLSAERTGYVSSRREAIRVDAEEAVSLQLVLDTVFVLSPLSVNARTHRSQIDYSSWLAPFHDRRRYFEALGGKFFTREDFDWMAAGTTDEVIVSLVPAYRLRTEPGAVRPKVVISRFGRLCEPFYYRNGVRVRKASDERIEDYVNLSEIVAIEIYRTELIAPGEVIGGCGGSVVLWTRPPGGRNEQ